MSTSAPPGSIVTSSSASTLLEVQGVCVDFSTDRGQLRAVGGVDLSIAAGETLGVVGESGSGKSVLMRTIMGILPRHGATVAGQARWGDVDLLGPRHVTSRLWGTEIAMVFQDPMTALNPTKRVGAHITESLRHHRRLGRRDAERRAIALLDQVGIPDAARRIDQYPHELSGGMRQRVTIAVALACEPRLLIADEPTTALDVTVQQQILELLGELQRERKMAMILVTHDLGVVAGRTDRVAVMYAGRVIETGSTLDVFENVRHHYTAGLLRSIPRMDRPSQAPLETMPGRPPDLVELPVGCRFAPRCPAATERCRTDDPALEGGGSLGDASSGVDTFSGVDTPSGGTSSGAGHRFACWHPLDSATLTGPPALGAR